MSFSGDKKEIKKLKINKNMLLNINFLRSSKYSTKVTHHQCIAAHYQI